MTGAPIGGAEATRRMVSGAVASALYQGGRPREQAGGWPASSVALLQRFPPRSVPATWPMTQQPKRDVVATLVAAPFVVEGAHLQHDRRRGLVHVLEWLQEQPGQTWQDRWIASAVDAEGNSAWRQLATRWMASTSRGPKDPDHACLTVGRGMLLLVCGDVIRPSLGWLLMPATPKKLLTEIARTRDPEQFAVLESVCRAGSANAHTTQLAFRRVATIVAAKGGLVGDITIGDCLELLRIADDLQGSAGATSPYFYQLLRTAGVFGGSAPAVRALKTQGQLSCEQLIDRYGIEYRPVRDLLVDYLRERQPAVDYATLHKLSYTLGRLSWRDLELHHHGIDSLRLTAEAATAWKQRITTKTTRSTAVDGQVTEVPAARINAAEHVVTVRAFYLDITQWAADDPARWGPWVAPCPIRDVEASHSKKRSHRKSRMDQRTREPLPVLPVLIATVDAERKAATERLHAAQAADAGALFIVADQTLRRSKALHASAGKVWAEDPHTGKRRDLTLEEHQAFWTWAAVEVLRHTGVRIEELTELSHHSLVQYKLPTTGEIIPLLHIA
ncbi:site-specific integrase, partial [Frankia sp. Cr1]|uniref:site-specific integrase n=1 Tax=Frankia sp. Cr1 TaxID=3073931 RepID=UPI003A0FDC24